MLTFMVLLNESPSTRAIQEHLASLPCRDEANLTMIQIKRQERNYFRQLKVWKMRLTSCIPALGMLTFQLISLSKPVGPKYQRTTILPYIVIVCCRVLPIATSVAIGRAIGCTRIHGVLASIPSTGALPSL